MIGTKSRRSVAERTSVGTTIRVGTPATAFVGEIILDEAQRVQSHARSIPRDIVLKVLLLHTRQDETFGRLVGRKDGQAYFWHVVGEDF